MIQTFRVAQRIERLPKYPFAIIGQRVRELRLAGKDVIQLDMGSPDLPPPPAVIQTLTDSASRPDTHGYAGYRGTPEFRQAVAAYYDHRFGVELDPESEVLPLIGSKEGIVNFTLAMVGPGDVVISPSLAYPAYPMGAQLAEASVYEMPMRPENNFLPILGDIPTDILEQGRLLWLNYPNNPTGAFASLEYYQEAVELCRANQLILCSDKPYYDLVFDGEPGAPSALQAAGAKAVTVEFMSLSKSFNMAGWRLGAAVGNAEALAALLTVKSNMDSGHFKAIYDAGVVALESTSQAWMDERNARYAARRDKIVATLPKIGMQMDHPSKGSLYVWAKVIDGDDMTYAERSLVEAHVSIAPGSIYGEDGQGYMRFSLGVTDERLDEALARLVNLWG